MLAIGNGGYILHNDYLHLKGELSSVQAVAAQQIFWQEATDPGSRPRSCRGKEGSNDCDRYRGTGLNPDLNHTDGSTFYSAHITEHGREWDLLFYARSQHLNICIF